VAQVASTYLLAAPDWNQVDVPPHCSSLGKVLYAFGCLPLPTGRLERRTSRTITTREALAAELATVRRTRVAITVDELETGLTAIAAPVEGRDGVIAALGVSGPTARLHDRVDQIGRLLVDESDHLSRLLHRRTQHAVEAGNEAPPGKVAPATSGATNEATKEGAA
jgi:DNA-binding IclR family transcriptional regulator